MKSFRSVGVVASFIVILLGVVVGGYSLGNRYLTSQDVAAKSMIATCKTHGAKHTVIIKDNQANPNYIKGKLCDTMIIKNADNVVRLMAFGQHDNHQAYDGIVEKELSPNQSFSVVFNKIGNYHFHDHIGDIVQGDFSVTE